MKSRSIKSLALASLAALSFAAPMAVAAPAAADPPGYHDGDRYSDHRDNRRDDRRDERRADREGFRDGRWDDRYNGYTYRGRWRYGPPPGEVRDYHPGYRAWRRGDRLPDYYRQDYRVVDYRHEHLRAPPRGYRYVRDDDRGDYLLVGIATGVILGVIASH